MKLETQVCSLDLSKRLRELGVKQDSLWWWNKFNKETPWVISYWDNQHTQGQVCSAFTVVGLGEMLPEKIKENRLLWMSKINNEYHLNYAKYTKDGEPYSWLSPHNWSATTEANARAKMLIYLLENKLMKGADIK